MDWLTTEVSGSPVTYLVVFVSAAADVLFPLIPSETIVIAASVLAAQGELLIFLIVPAAALGALLGDNLAYLIGRRLGGPVVRRVLRSDKSLARLEWARNALRRRGPLVIIGGRFIPGGRTASTLAAGTLGMPYRRFILADAVAATCWALYVALLGYVGGAAFEDNVWLPLLIALGVAMMVAAGVEAWRRFQRHRGRELFGGKAEG
jgi:membrane-associated protein